MTNTMSYCDDIQTAGIFGLVKWVDDFGFSRPLSHYLVLTTLRKGSEEFYISVIDI